MRALVTGATGFIGAALVETLRFQGWAVQTVGRQRDHAATFAYDILSAPRDSLRDIVERSRCDAIFHLAGTTSDADGLLERVNVGFAEAVLDAASRAAHRPATLLAGTAAEYGELPPHDLPAREDHPCRPATRYGASKLRQTMLGLDAAATGQRVFLPRMFNVIGARMRPHLSLGRFARDIAALGTDGGVITAGPLDAQRDFVAVGDAARAMVALTASPEAMGKVVNICSGVAIRMQDVVDALVAAAQAPVSIAIDQGRSGVSAVPIMYGCTRRQESLGISIAAPNLRHEMRALLRSHRPAVALAMGDAP